MVFEPSAIHRTDKQICTGSAWLKHGEAANGGTPDGRYKSYRTKRLILSETGRQGRQTGKRRSFTIGLPDRDPLQRGTLAPVLAFLLRLARSSVI